VVHAQIDALRRELVDRLRDEGNVVISGSDFLDPGSAGVREPRNPSPRSGSDGIALDESSFQEGPIWTCRGVTASVEA
jgi:hypothetical protein